MTWTEVLDDFNVVVWSWLGWGMARGTQKHWRERRELAAMERDRWTRLAAGKVPSLDGAPSETSLDDDLGIRVAREYLRGENSLGRAESDAAAAYIVADVSARWPPSLDDLRHIATAIGDPGSLDYLKSVVPGGCAEPPARPRSRWRFWRRWRPAPAERVTPPAPVTDDTALAVVIRLMFTFCPPGLPRGEYLDQARDYSDRVSELAERARYYAEHDGRRSVEAADSYAGRVLPALLLRRGLNTRAAAERAA